jgi:site-specific recombinase XerD
VYHALPDGAGKPFPARRLSGRGGTLDDFVLRSRLDHISARRYAWLVDEWTTGIELRGADYGTHSLRRTKASIIYTRIGNLRAAKILLGHTKIESTARYLGVEIEDVQRFSDTPPRLLAA